MTTVTGGGGAARGMAVGWSGEAAEGPAQQFLVDAGRPVRARAVRVWAVSWAQARKLPCAAWLSAKVMSSGSASAQMGWNRGMTSRTSLGVRRVKCCQMKMREESIGSRRSTVWQPSPPTKMIASWVEGSSHR
ncbi:hypothetical protein SANT12839_099390 [Streptomyces antimycoticus]|uniref:Uncharacterized protein n=1 Tax=Streptomyces antimycoticus TaxID=68175 RepID=A0A4D4KRI8_9ACTN|nr:hypothetical protein SANT12839_099390 [Streptomyces antimycoticus]